MNKRFFYLLSSIIWMGVIFYFSSQNADASSEDSSIIRNFLIGVFTDSPSETLLYIAEVFVRKVAHISEFFILAVLVYKTLTSFDIQAKKAVICIIVCFLYAVSDEVHQFFVPGRACRWYDVLIDTCGSLFAVGIFELLKKRSK